MSVYFSAMIKRDIVTSAKLGGCVSAFVCDCLQTQNPKNPESILMKWLKWDKDLPKIKAAKMPDLYFFSVRQSTGSVSPLH